MSNPQRPKRSKMVKGAVRIVTAAMANTRAAKTLEVNNRNQGNDKK